MHLPLTLRHATRDVTKKNLEQHEVARGIAFQLDAISAARFTQKASQSQVSTNRRPLKFIVYSTGDGAMTVVAEKLFQSARAGGPLPPLTAAACIGIVEPPPVCTKNSRA